MEGKVTSLPKATKLTTNFSLPVNKVVQAHIGPNYDFGLDASFQKSTGDDRKKGIAIFFDLTMNTKDHSLSTWELVGAAGLHVWWHPLFDEKPEFDLFHKNFTISRR
mmetsp:Transcript_2100/g.2219  ORF Transcript_2100/g.2219 Transcript_2100/m.2219 type:complete len:107 (-) Transcript_2100:19-339(-)